MVAHNVYIDTLQTPGTVPATNVETVALVLPGVSVPAQVQIVIEALAALITGTATTNLIARVRRGATVAGALVGDLFTVQVGAALRTSVAAQVGDQFNADVANQSYCLTLQQTAATGNASTLFASMQASWISQ